MAKNVQLYPDRPRRIVDHLCCAHSARTFGGKCFADLASVEPSRELAHHVLEITFRRCLRLKRMGRRQAGPRLFREGEAPAEPDQDELRSWTSNPRLAYHRHLQLDRIKD